MKIFTLIYQLGVLQGRLKVVHKEFLNGLACNHFRHIARQGGKTLADILYKPIS